MKPIDITRASGVSHRTAAGAGAARGSEPVRAVRGPEGDASPLEAVSVQSAGDSLPVDLERVREIRRAIEENRYPVIPTRIADAMIAAGYLLRTK